MLYHELDPSLALVGGAIAAEGFALTPITPVLGFLCPGLSGL